ncbi:MAG: hypothetical protein ACXABN_18675, partial [Candidatus Thorarchaeota archaeon]
FWIECHLTIPSDEISLVFIYAFNIYVATKKTATNIVLRSILIIGWNRRYYARRCLFAIFN